MNNKLLTTAAFTTLALSTFVPIAQASLVTTDANYYIRPALRVDLGELIDGIEENGATQSTMSQGVLGYSESTVSLETGTVQMYLEYFGGTDSGNLQTFGGFGERITIVGGAGTYWDFDFAIDGFLDVEGGGTLNDAVEFPPAFFYDAGLAIYDANETQGDVFYNNFIPGFNDFTPEFFQQDSVREDIDASEEFSSYDLFASVNGSIYLESDYEVFDIFTFSNMVLNSQIGDGLESYVADLTNTARYGQSFAQGVDAFSSSGTFLNLATPPPPPPSVNVSEPHMMTLIGLAIMGWIYRFKRQYG